ncbi:MAG: hypothetical protein AB1330_02585 [Bacillota bacterium]
MVKTVAERRFLMFALSLILLIFSFFWGFGLSIWLGWVAICILVLVRRPLMKFALLLVLLTLIFLWRFPNLWFGKIPDSRFGYPLVVLFACVIAFTLLLGRWKLGRFIFALLTFFGILVVTDYYNLPTRVVEAVNDPAKKVPADYYDVHPYGIYPSHTTEDLYDFLNHRFFLPRACEEEVFDCSEAAAMLEWALETAGFNAYIAAGNCPWNPKEGRHAWVLVDTDEGQRVAVEATVFTGKAGFFEKLWRWFSGRTRGVVYPGDRDYENYHKGYDHLFPDIYRAVRGGFGLGLGQFNWWEGAWGFK